jgi:DNA-binding NtrC family response regulator
LINQSRQLNGAVLVVDDHQRARDSMADVLRSVGHRVDCCCSAAEALLRVKEQSYDVIITDLRMPGMTGLEFMQALNDRSVDAQMIMVTAHASVAAAVEAMRLGAFDFIEKPFNIEELESLVTRALAHADACDQRSLIPNSQGGEAAMIGTSQPMKTLHAKINQAAPTGETILITGESGVGKELVATAAYAVSDRADAPFVRLNCPALSPHLMESDLFGHVRGSFTSADAPRVGRFELADKGTILLDEVTEIGLPLQAKLLRVLQERKFERVGSSETLSIDVRVIATSNRILRDEVDEGRFREDLYFRLAVVPIHVPPLRERPSDLPLLIEHFCTRAAQRLGREPCQFGADALARLQDYHWPGNVRELENIVTRGCIMFAGRTMSAGDIGDWLIDGASPAPRLAQAGVPVGMSLQQMERKLIEATLDQFDGHRVRTAQALGIGVRTLTNKLRAYGYAPREKSYSRAA